MQNTNHLIALLHEQMFTYERGNPERIAHLTKVHDYARTIGLLEGLDEETLATLEAATLVHDIGIKVSLEKYGNSRGDLQEKEGPPLARDLLTKLDFSSPIIERVAFLVGHHHTYTNIEGIDYQILVESDFLVNLQEKKTGVEAIRKVYEEIFKTKSGKQFCGEMFGI
ncbi:HD domain-containing protein [uncultured Sphaerochaeta sp.]|uniref:HD domain-containing protein n=1 Tax=uncultured Sphaerochaeta sp. TaxID=886478 RepID=UPI0029CA6634|nr:HD domain-containing protein [uncultured Sphaerochaeta sp.]